MSIRIKTLVMAVCLALLAPAIFIPTAVHADDGVNGRGYIEPDKGMYRVPSGDRKLQKSSQDLPERYDAREEAWFSGIKVKNRKSFDRLCWAFAITTAAEISYAKEIYEETGNVEDFEFSPTHLAYFSANRVSDPLGNTADDKVLEYSAWEGSTFTVAMNHLATWSGMGPESNTPFQDLVDYVDAGSDLDDFTYDPQYAYDDCAILQNTLYYDEGTANVETVKQLILDYGAVAAGIYYSPDNFTNGDPDTGSFYYTGDRGNNHAVTIVGWDDSYSRENFAPKKGDSYSLRPEHDGAWIVQNSLGTERHNRGYFYMSYESTDMKRGGIVAFDMQDPDAYDYNYQYDGCPILAYSGDDTWEVGIDTDCGNKAANIFRAATGITLRAIGLTEFTYEPVSYRADIYTGIKDPSDPESGKRACSFNFTTESGGCKTLELPKPVYIRANDTYSIVITILSDHSAIGREETALVFYAHFDPGQSFIYDAAANTWEDLYAHDTCFRIKGFADRAPDNVECPEFIEQPAPVLSWTYGDTPEGGSELSVKVREVTSGTLSYQWYKANSETGAGTEIPGATGSKYTIPSGSKSAGGLDAGTYYYYCVATNTEQIEGVPIETDTESDRCTVTVGRREVKLTWSNEDPATGEKTPLVYNGEPQAPAAAAGSLMDGDNCSVMITDDSKKTNANPPETPEYTATAGSLSNDNYKLPSKPTTTFTIVPKSIEGAVITLESAEYAYTGSDHTVKITGVVLSDGMELDKNTDYVITGGSTGKDVGTYTLKITGNSNYKDTASKDWRIEPVIPVIEINPTARTLTYNGQAQELVTAGKATGGTMQYALGNATEATEPYTTSIPAKTDAGTYYVWYKVVGDKNHNNVDPAVLTVTISEGSVPAGKTSIKGARITGIKAKTWTGKALKQRPVVKLSGKTLINGKDYTVTYKNNKNVGKATLTIKGKGDYTGTVRKTFRIDPKGTTIAKLAAGKKAITVKWKKQAKKMSASRITGYQVQVATNKAFTKGKKTVTVKKASTVSRKITKLKAGKRYYVRICTYKTIGGKKYCSKWSKAKKVTTKR